MKTYEQRQEQPVTLRPHVARNVWSEVKAARDRAEMLAGSYKEEAKRLNVLLALLKEDGCADHLPTIEEAQAAWRGS